jgi:hypothetical protein
MTYQEGFNDCKEAILKKMSNWDIEFKLKAIREVEDLQPTKIDYERPLIKQLLK